MHIHVCICLSVGVVTCIYAYIQRVVCLYFTYLYIYRDVCYVSIHYICIELYVCMLCIHSFIHNTQSCIFVSYISKHNTELFVSVLMYPYNMYPTLCMIWNKRPSSTRSQIYVNTYMTSCLINHTFRPIVHTTLIYTWQVVIQIKHSDQSFIQHCTCFTMHP